MSYINAKKLLPENILEIIQEYIEGEYIYIPKKDESKKSWGANTNIKKELASRNDEIYKQYLDGSSTKELAENFYLSEKSIQRIVLKYKRQRQIS